MSKLINSSFSRVAQKFCLADHILKIPDWLYDFDTDLKNKTSTQIKNDLVFRTHTSWFFVI